MQAVILAGGLGTRLRPLTFTRPKPLLPVANVPLLDRVLGSLPQDVDRAVVAGGYRMDDLRHHVERADLDLEVVLVEEKEPLGTGGAIKHVERHLDGAFFVLNGDVLSSLDLAALQRFHEGRGGAGTIALWRVDDPRHFGVMEMDGDRIRRFVEKPATRAEAPSELANAGTYLLEPQVLDLVPAGRKVSIERETFPRLLDEGGELYGFPFDGWWVDCGRPETYLRAHELVLAHEHRQVALAPGAVVDGAHVEDWASLGEDAVASAGSRVARSVLLPRARVEGHADVEDTVLGEGAVVERGAVVRRAVLGDGARVPAKAHLVDARVPPPDADATGGVA